MVGIPGLGYVGQNNSCQQKMSIQLGERSHLLYRSSLVQAHTVLPLISFIDKHWHPCSVLLLAVVVCILAPYLLLKDEGIER